MPYIIKMVREKLSSKEITVKIYSPGIGAQGVELGSALKAGADYEIIGVGGAETRRDVIEFILTGASAVQIGTGFLRRGHNIVQEIIHGIRNNMEKTGANNLYEFVGIAHRR